MQLLAQEVTNLLITRNREACLQAGGTQYLPSSCWRQGTGWMILDALTCFIFHLGLLTSLKTCCGVPSLQHPLSMGSWGPPARCQGHPELCRARAEQAFTIELSAGLQARARGSAHAPGAAAVSMSEPQRDRPRASCGTGFCV